MNKILSKLKSLASLFLTEEQAKVINEYVVKEKWTMLRLYLADLSEEFELQNLIADADQEQLDRWVVVDMMNDIAIELAIQMQKILDEENKPRERRKRITRKKESTGY